MCEHMIIREPLIKTSLRGEWDVIGWEKQSVGSYFGKNSHFSCLIRPKGRKNPKRGVMNRPPWQAYTGSHWQRAHVIG